MKREVARPGTRGDRSRRRVVCSQCAGNGFKLVNQHLVQSEVTGECETVARVRCDKMCVRTFLTLFVGARSPVLDKGRWHIQPAILLDRQRFDTAAAIVSDENSPAGCVHGNVARPVSPGRLLIQEGQLAVVRINGKGTHTPALFTVEIADFVRGVKKSAIWMNRKKTWAGGFGGQLGNTQLATRCIKTGNVDSLAPRTGISADVNKEDPRCVCGFGRRRAGLQ